MAGLGLVETFHWRPLATKSKSTSYRVRSTRFGDGYRQMAGDGINTQKESLMVTIAGDEAKINAVVDFLDRHAGYKPFEFTNKDVAALYVCGGHSVAQSGWPVVWSINLTMEAFNA